MTPVSLNSIPYNFCPACGAPPPHGANYCPACGAALHDTESIELRDDAPVTLTTFFPRLLDAFEHVAIRDFFRTLAAVKLLALHPFDYDSLRRQGKLPPLFTMLLMATFAGTFKLYNDPVYGPLMAKLDFGNDVAQTLVTILTYMVLSSFFGIWALLTARLVHIVLRLPIERDLFVRAMMTVFILFAFLIDILSPFWNIPVQRGVIFWGYYDLVKTVLTLIYGYLVYRGLRYESEPTMASQQAEA
jgi:hypothetical protein